MAEIITMILGACSTNAYLVIDGKNAVVIDPADDADSIMNILEQKETTLKKILLTHGHADHIAACGELVNRTGAEVFVHELDFPMISETDKIYPRIKHFIKRIKLLKNAVFVHENDIIVVENSSLKFKVIETPGHSKGSVMYFFENSIFTGDTIFKENVGRTENDFDFDIMMKSMSKLINLDSDSILYPGHSESTTLYHEIKYNPFAKNFKS